MRMKDEICRSSVALAVAVAYSRDREKVSHMAERRPYSGTGLEDVGAPAATGLGVT